MTDPSRGEWSELPQIAGPRNRRTGRIGWDLVLAAPGPTGFIRLLEEEVELGGLTRQLDLEVEAHQLLPRNEFDRTSNARNRIRRIRMERGAEQLAFRTFDLRLRAPPGRWPVFRLDHEPAAVLHQRMSHEAELGSPTAMSIISLPS